MNEEKKERVIICVMMFFLLTLLVIGQIPNFNLWGKSHVFEVTPTGILYYKGKAGIQLIKVTERGKMGVFKLCGNIPNNMTRGNRYRFTAQRGLWGHRSSPTRAIYRVSLWEEIE